MSRKGGSPNVQKVPDLQLMAQDGGIVTFPAKFIEESQVLTDMTRDSKISREAIPIAPADDVGMLEDLINYLGEKDKKDFNKKKFFQSIKDLGNGVVELEKMYNLAIFLDIPSFANDISKFVAESIAGKSLSEMAKYMGVKPPKLTEEQKREIDGLPYNIPIPQKLLDELNVPPASV